MVSEHITLGQHRICVGDKYIKVQTYVTESVPFTFIIVIIIFRNIVDEWDQ